MYTELEIKDNLELCLETISGIINATGTAEQKKTLLVLKENIGSMVTADPENYISLAHETMELASCKEFAADFIADEINTLKFNISSLSTLKLKEALDAAKSFIAEETTTTGASAEPDVVSQEVIEETKEEEKSDKKEEEKMKEEVKQEKIEETKETKQDKTIADLKKQLEEAKDKANKCKTSTLAKVAKVGLGLGALAAAAAGGYYVAKNYSGNTTIILSNRDEE